MKVPFQVIVFFIVAAFGLSASCVNPPCSTGTASRPDHDSKAPVSTTEPGSAENWTTEHQNTSFNGIAEQPDTSFAAGSLRYMETHGSGIYSPEDLSVRGALPEHTRYPRLGGVFYTPITDEPALLEALSRFDLLVVGNSICMSSGAAGGHRLGKWRGEGNNRDVVYDLNRVNSRFQEIITKARKLNPGLRFIVQATVSHLPALQFRHGTTSPGRFFADNISPRYFAYTPFLEILEPVQADPSITIFRFDPGQIKKGMKKAGFKTGSGKWTVQNAFDWTYCCFYDNDNGATRGNFEIMAVKKIDADAGLLHVAERGKAGRTIIGTTQGYAAGARFGFLNSSNAGFGALSFYMNRTTACETADGEGGPLNWIGYVLRHMKRFVLPSSYKGRFLAAGLLADADDEDATTLYSWRFLYPKRFLTDFDLDGKPDDPIEASKAFMEGMKVYVRGVRRAARELGRDDLFFINNGNFLDARNRQANGRYFEDFNGSFQDASVPLAEKRYIDLFRRGSMAEPVTVIVNERDKNTTPVSTNWAAHRHTMAFTCIAGEGYYAMTGLFSIGFKIQEKQGTDRWYDEYSVDKAGTGCNHPHYLGETPASGRGWLGRPLTRGVKLAPGTYAREFENGVVLCTGRPGGFEFDLETLFPGAVFRRIKGADDGKVNSGAETGKTIRIARRDGIFLVRVGGNE